MGDRYVCLQSLVHKSVWLLDADSLRKYGKAYPAALNAVDRHGNTPLVLAHMWVSSFGKWQWVEFLYIFFVFFYFWGT